MAIDTNSIRSSSGADGGRSGKKHLFRKMFSRSHKNLSRGSRKSMDSGTSTASWSDETLPAKTQENGKSGIERRDSHAGKGEKVEKESLVETDNSSDEGNEIGSNGFHRNSESPVFSSTSSSQDNLAKHRHPYMHLEPSLDDVIDTYARLGDGSAYERLNRKSLITPKYLKIHRRHKGSAKAINKLFLAQELSASDQLYVRDELIMSSDDLSSANVDESALMPTQSRDNIAVKDLKKMSSERFSTKENEYGTTKNNFHEIFVMQFSKDGKYLAAAGRDMVIRIWQVISSPLGRLKQENFERDLRERKQGNNKDKNNSKSGYTAPIFHQIPIKVFKGHTQSILCLDWSKNNFLISGSMDKTVKLWHVDRSECLETFYNDDFVTAVRFHPRDDRFFLSGSLDNELRLWSILERNVTFSRNLGDETLITALDISPDGACCIVGGFNGVIIALETKGLYIIRAMQLKKKSFGHVAGGSKITGIHFFENPLQLDSETYSELQKWNILISTNDSKIRLIQSGPKKIVTKFKGFSNNKTSIAASISPNMKYVVSGSEDHWCYIWEIVPPETLYQNHKVKRLLKEFVTEGKAHISNLPKHKKKVEVAGNEVDLDVRESRDSYAHYDNHRYISFHAHHSKVNVAIFAPESTQRLLELSDDPIFSLLDVDKKLRDHGDAVNNIDAKLDSPKGDFANASIIVTTDQYGLIRIFRDDAGYEIRKKIIDDFKSLYLHNGCRGRSYFDNEIVDHGLSLASSLKLDIPELKNVSRRLQAQARSLTPYLEANNPQRTNEDRVRDGVTSKNFNETPIRIQNSENSYNSSHSLDKPGHDVSSVNTSPILSDVGNVNKSILNDGEYVFNYNIDDGTNTNYGASSDVKSV